MEKFSVAVSMLKPKLSRFFMPDDFLSFPAVEDFKLYRGFFAKTKLRNHIFLHMLQSGFETLNLLWHVPKQL